MTGRDGNTGRYGNPGCDGNSGRDGSSGRDANSGRDGNGGRGGMALWLAGAALAAAPAAAQAAETIAYKYDARGRLVEVVRNDGANVVVTTYAYDRAGNRTAKTTSGSPNPGPP